MAITNAQLAQQVSELLDLWRVRELQFRAWLSGTAAGGPYSDGRYPLQSYLDETYYVYSPAALANTVSGPAGAAGSHAAAAQAARDAAAASQGAAESARNLALTYRDASHVARDLALQYRDGAASHEANASTHRNRAKDWASKAVDSVVESALYSALHYATKAGEHAVAAAAGATNSASSASAASTSASNAATSASSAAASAAAAQTWNPANYAALAGATFTGALAISTGTAQPLELVTSSGSPWHLNLRRSDLGHSSRVFNNGAGWHFEHGPYVPSLRAPSGSFLFTPAVGTYLTDIRSDHSAASAIRLLDSTGTGRVWLYASGGDFGVLNGAGGWGLRLTAGREILYNAGEYTYGSHYMRGSTGGYAGIAFPDISGNPTLMMSGSATGIYKQSGGWSFYDDWSSNFYVSRPIRDSGGAAYLRFNSSGFSSGRVYVQQGGSPAGSAEGDITLIW